MSDEKLKAWKCMCTASNPQENTVCGFCDCERCFGEVDRQPTPTAEKADVVEAVARFLADIDDGDRAEAGTNPLMAAHIADFRAALQSRPAEPAGAWDHRYRWLDEGEIILSSDEIRNDDGTWQPAVCVGQEAPSPLYTSHRVYRRLKGEPAGEEPVAWMYKTHLGQSLTATFRRTHYDGFPVTDETPLYARPAPSNPDRLVEALREIRTVSQIAAAVEGEEDGETYALIAARAEAALSAPDLDGEKGE